MSYSIHVSTFVYRMHRRSYFYLFFANIKMFVWTNFSVRFRTPHHAARSTHDHSSNRRCDRIWITPLNVCCERRRESHLFRCSCKDASQEMIYTTAQMFTDQNRSLFGRLISNNLQRLVPMTATTYILFTECVICTIVMLYYVYILDQIRVNLSLQNYPTISHFSHAKYRRHCLCIRRDPLVLSLYSLFTLLFDADSFSL